MHRTRNLLPLAAITGLCAVGCLQPDGAKKTLPGHELYAACVSCHGQDGAGNQKLAAPAIAGLPAWYVEAQLVKFRSGYRGYHPEDIAGLRMRPMSRQMMDMGEVKAVAAHVAGMPVQKSVATITGDPEAGKGTYSTCAQCHGANGLGEVENPQFPVAKFAPPIARMPDWYLVAQIKNFQSGVRGAHPEDKTGKEMILWATTLSDEQTLKNVIAYIGTLSK